MTLNRYFKNVLVILALLALSITPALGRTITDEAGRTIEIPDNPKRIVALTPWVVEVLFDLEQPPIGRPSSAVYPQEALQVEAHGSSYRLNFERILALEPDLIIGNKNLHSGQLPQLETIGAPVLLFNIDSYEDVLTRTQILGEITGKSEKARIISDHIESRFNDIRSKIPANRKISAVILVGSSEAFSVAKENSYVGDLLKILGAENIATGPEHRPGFTKLSLEYIAQADPDVIFAIKPARDPQNATSALEGYDKNPLWSSLSAVKNGRVYELSPEVCFMNPGPRVVQALEEMASALYPEVF